MRWSACLVALVGCTPAPAIPTTSGSTGGAAATPTETPTATPAETASATPSTTPTAAPSASVAPPAGPPPSATLDPELPSGTSVVHVGDSMADALGKDLKLEMDALGIKTWLKYKEATYIPQWASTSDTMGFRGLVRQHHPDLIVITLGGNELAMPDPKERVRPIRELAKFVGDTPCLWIAAPLWPDAKNTGLFDVIKENCAPCIFVDTNAMLKLEVLTSDHVHPTLAERKRWAKFMVRWLKHNRDPNGPKPWSFKPSTEPPPAE